MSLKKILTTKSEGFAVQSFKDVLSKFKNGFSSGFDKGASLSIYSNGSLVLNARGGLVDDRPQRPWTENTVGYFFSGGKFLSAVVIASLVEKGFLSYEEKISKYWPEFASNGKENITLSMLLSHTAGLSVSDENYELRWMRESQTQLKDFLQKQQPLWEPGKEIGYSNILVGLYLNEIVKRVDPKERNVSEYFHEEIAVPFGLDIYIGLPKSQFYRVPRLFWPQYSKEELQKMMVDFQGNQDFYRKSIYQPKDWDSRCKLNDPEFASLPCPSSHAIGTASAAAKLAGILSNGGKYEGKTLLTQRAIDQLQKPIIYQTDCIFGTLFTYGPGPMLIPVRQGNKTWFVFGHTGLGGQVILADPVKKFGFAYCTNHPDLFTTLDNNKWKPLLEALYSSIEKNERAFDKVRMFGTYKDFLRDLKDNPIQCKL